MDKLGTNVISLPAIAFLDRLQKDVNDGRCGVSRSAMAPTSHAEQSAFALGAGRRLVRRPAVGSGMLKLSFGPPGGRTHKVVIRRSTARRPEADVTWASSATFRV